MQRTDIFNTNGQENGRKARKILKMNSRERNEEKTDSYRMMTRGTKQKDKVQGMQRGRRKRKVSSF